MKPRIFVSSTFYDLKYIREDLSNFIKAHDFEPIMFEEGDIGYTPGKALDESCYETMHSADMVLLIIGGNYGSPATGEVKDDFKEYMSVTRKEFKAAIDIGTPVYVFIDNKVYVEYEIYEANYKNIEEEKQDIKFRNVKDVNVFRFIKEIRSVGNISITEFEKIVQIKEFLSKQWSDMFKAYLGILKEKQSIQKVENTVDDMKMLIRKMDVMLDTVGKKILNENNSGEYESVLGKQKILSLCNEIVKSMVLEDVHRIEDSSKRYEFANNLLTALYESIKTDIWKKFRNDNFEIAKEWFTYFADRNIFIDGCTTNLDSNINKNTEIFENGKLRKSLADELIKDDNYNEFFKND